MDTPIRRPEEILAYRPLRRILASKPCELWSVDPPDWVSCRSPAGQDGRRPVRTGLQAPCIAAQQITGIDLGRGRHGEQRHHSGRFAHFCRLLELMHQHGIRQLPVIDQGKPITVVSIRDLLREAAAHYAKIIAELERERITLFISTA